MRLERIINRQYARSMKARGVREKDMLHENFKKAFNLGAEMFKIRILNATAGYEYESETAAPMQCSDPESDGSLASPVVGNGANPAIDYEELNDRIHFLAGFGYPDADFIPR